MRIQKLVSIGILLLGSAAGLSAQNSLAISHDDACWQSLSALRACELAQEKRAIEQSERCTSYPEYYCAPADGQGNAEESKKESKANHAANGRDRDPSASNQVAQDADRK
jgi:hypothetical protein